MQGERCVFVGDEHQVGMFSGTIGRAGTVGPDHDVMRPDVALRVARFELVGQRALGAVGAQRGPTQYLVELGNPFGGEERAHRGIVGAHGRSTDRTDA